MHAVEWMIVIVAERQRRIVGAGWLMRPLTVGLGYRSAFFGLSDASVTLIHVKLVTAIHLRISHGPDPDALLEPTLGNGVPINPPHSEPRPRVG